MSLLPGTFVSRLWRTAFVIVLAFGLGGLFLYRVSSADVLPLKESFSQLPLEIAGYIGKEQKLDEQVARSVAATDSVSRMYRNSNGVEISVHAAAFDSIGRPTLPHPPTVCYVASGAQIVDQRQVTVAPENSTEPPIVAQVMTVDREGQKSFVLYWYRWDNDVCTTRTQAMWTRLRLVGCSEWPPVVKVMLEIPCGNNPDESLKALTAFAANINEWTKTL
ncbi:MAG: EpsI family protein [Pirellulaceae bacterium]